MENATGDQTKKTFTLFVISLSLLQEAMLIYQIVFFKITPIIAMRNLKLLLLAEKKVVELNNVHDTKRSFHI